MSETRPSRVMKVIGNCPLIAFGVPKAVIPLPAQKQLGRSRREPPVGNGAAKARERSI